MANAKCMYVLVKRPYGEACHIHGLTDHEFTAETWRAGSSENDCVAVEMGTVSAWPISPVEEEEAA